MSPTPEFPEHEKLHKVKDQTQAIGEFLDYSEYILAEYRCPHGYKNPADCEESEYCRAGTGDTMLFQVTGSINDILAEHFGIDLNKLELEKREMIRQMSESSNASSAT